MCGIFGQVGSNSLNIHRVLSDMSSAMEHRGPDDQGFYHAMFPETHVGLGMNRLAIIDIEGGSQPLKTSDGQVTLVFNGEIYNYKSLRLREERSGYQFRTESDTEVILALYLRYGTRCVEYLRGMFAFGIYDQRNEKVFLFRDHVGIKPLYWYHSNGRFLFASEITGITCVTSNRRLNERAVLKYLTFRYVTGPDTIWDTIHSLAPGHFLTYDLKAGKTEVTRWWTLTCKPLRISYSDAKKELARLLVKSVRDRMQSEVPLGSYLSGGVDSSVISLIANRAAETPLNVYNIGYADANEFKHASALAKEFRMNYHQFHMRDSDVVASIPAWVRHMDQPMCDPATIPTLYLSKYVTKRLTVMLSGEGADELFTGYWQYDRLLRSGNVGYIEHLRGSSYFPELNGLVNPRILSRYNPVADHAKLWDSEETPLRRMAKFDLHTWLSDNLLQKVDRMTMGASIEARVPFLSQEVVRFAYNLPDDYKWGLGNTKRILKDVAEELGVPTSITRRQKMGFTVPIQSLLRGPLRTELLDSLDRTRELPYINADVLDARIGRFLEGDLREGLFTWNIFVLSKWLAYHT